MWSSTLTMKTTSHSKPFDCTRKKRGIKTKLSQGFLPNYTRTVLANYESQKNTWWIVVKVMEFSLSCLRERKFSLSRSDIKSIKALSTLRQPFPSATTLLSPSTATNLVDKNTETSSSKYWRTCREKWSNFNMWMHQDLGEDKVI